MTYLIPAIVGVSGLIIGAALTYFIAFSGAKSKAKRILQEAEAQGEVMKKNKLLEVKEKFLNKKAELEKEVAARSQKLQQSESRIKQRELQLNQHQSQPGRTAANRKPEARRARLTATTGAQAPRSHQRAVS